MRITVFSQILLMAFAVFAVTLFAIGWFISWQLAGGLALLAPVLLLVELIARTISRIRPFRRWRDKMRWHAASREIARKKHRESTASRRDRARRIREEYED